VSAWRPATLFDMRDPEGGGWEKADLDVLVRDDWTLE